MTRKNVVKTKSNADSTKEISENKHINAYSQDTQTEKNQEEKRGSSILALISFLFPIIGAALFILLMKKRPRAAKRYGMCALVSFVINMISVVVITIASTTLLKTVGDPTSSYAYNNPELYTEVFYDE